MSFVVSENCITCKYTHGVDACPTGAFREGPKDLPIKPDDCIDGRLCVAECPVDAIFKGCDISREWEMQPHDPTHWGLARAERTPISVGNRPAGVLAMGRSRVRRREGHGNRERWRRLAQLPRDEPIRLARRPGYQAMR